MSAAKVERPIPEGFREWFARNYPGPSTISVPEWHAPKIWRAAMAFLPDTEAAAYRAGMERAAKWEALCLAAVDVLCSVQKEYNAAAILPDGWEFSDKKDIERRVRELRAEYAAASTDAAAAIREEASRG